MTLAKDLNNDDIINLHPPFIGQISESKGQAIDLMD